MPNYTYKCDTCNIVNQVPLPISVPPEAKFKCGWCDGWASRIISKPEVVVKDEKKLGKWFKDKTGKDLFGDK